MKKYGLSWSKLKLFGGKALRNFIWHLTLTELQVERMQHVLEEYSIKGMFFTTANLIERNPSRLQTFKKHEVAPHGYTHLDYSTLNFEAAYQDMKHAVEVFRNNGQKVDIFRAPYSSPALADGNSWYDVLKKCDVPYSSSRLQHPPNYPYRVPNGTMEFPIMHPTDDAVIDVRNIRKTKFVLKEMLRKIYQNEHELAQHKKETGTVIVYCLHPLRIGQNNYLPVLSHLLESLEKRDAYELISFHDAIDEWNKGLDPGRNLVVISGDIDCWTYYDYIRRLRY